MFLRTVIYWMFLPLQVALIDMLENQPLQDLDPAIFPGGQFAVDRDLVELYAQRDMHPNQSQENG